MPTRAPAKHRYAAIGMLALHMAFVATCLFMLNWGEMDRWLSIVIGTMLVSFSAAIGWELVKAFRQRPGA